MFVFHIFLFIFLFIPFHSFSDEVSESKTMVVFWSETCPVCKAQKPFLQEISEFIPGLTIESYELSTSDRYHALFNQMALMHGIEPQGVPTIFYDGHIFVGDSDANRIEMIRVLAKNWPEQFSDLETPIEESKGNIITIPLVGDIDLSITSPVVSTIVISLVDGINPCSLWLLALLIGIMVNTRSRSRVVIVGLTFLMTTTLIYGSFMMGAFSIMNITQIAEMAMWISASVAILYGLVNVKDYWALKTGLSFTIPDQFKPIIFKNIQGVRSASSMFAIIGSTILLAGGVAIAELPCTAGFPVIWSGIISATGIDGGAFWGLLGLYLVIYLLDELVLFILAIITMRSLKLGEESTRNLKLIGGSFMVVLGVYLIFAPSAIESLIGIITIVAITIIIVGINMIVRRLTHSVAMLH